MKLNLGCSNDHKAGYVNVDCAPPADKIVDLNMRWPWEASSVDEIYAHDVFEHVAPYPENDPWGKPFWESARNPKVWVMNEAWRVLKPGGKLDLAVPSVMLGDGRLNPGAFADPTHVSYWTLDDQYYFDERWNNPQGERGRLGPAYGIKALFRGEWKLVEYGQGAERRAKIVAMLEAVK